jgi:polyhydroxyalkanoate synthesis regulator phasin
MEFIGAGWDVLSQKKGVDHLGKAGARVLGGYLSGIARVAKPLRDAWAQYDADERAYREDPESAKDKFLNEVSRSIPGVIRLSDQKKQTDIDGKVLEQPFPIGRIFGVNVVHPEFIREAGSKAEQWARRLWEKDYDKMSPEEKRAYTLRNQIKKAVRAGKMDAETASKRIDSYVKEGRLSEASATRLKNEMVMSPLEFKVKMEFSADKPDDVENLKKVLSVATPEEKEALTKVLLKKTMTPEMRKDLGVNKVPKAGVDAMLNAKEMKNATTDDLVSYMNLEGYTAEDKAKVTQALLQKAGNALKSKTLTAEEIENIKTVLPSFKEDDAKTAQQNADNLNRKADNAEKLQGANVSDNLKTTLQSLGISLPGFGDSLTPKKGGEKVKLTPEQQAKYERETLERIEAKVRSLQTTTAFKNAPEGVRKKMIEGIIRKQRSEEQKETKDELLNAPKLADLAYGKDGGRDSYEDNSPMPPTNPDNPNKWKGQRQSENIIDKRNGTPLYEFENLITGDIDAIRQAKFKGGNKAERQEARRILNEQIEESRHIVQQRKVDPARAKKVLTELLKVRARF